MRPGGLGLHASRSMAIGLLGLACALGTAQAQDAPPPATLIVSPGLSATELALDQVPAGTTITQFLLALYKLNPAAFLNGDLNRLQVKARLRLPSAEEANQVPLEQAREDIARLQAGLPLASENAASTPAQTPATEAPAEAASAPPPTAPASPILSVTPPSPSSPSSPPSPASPPGLPLAWLGAGAAVLLALATLNALRMRRRPKPTAPPPTPSADEREQEAQGRFQPALPQEHKALAPSPAQPVPKPALFDLDLNLDGPAPPLDTKLPQASPRTGKPLPGALPKLDLDLDLSNAPRAQAPGPLDLSGLSLDLDTPTPAKDKKP